MGLVLVLESANKLGEESVEVLARGSVLELVDVLVGRWGHTLEQTSVSGWAQMLAEQLAFQKGWNLEHELDQLWVVKLVRLLATE